MFEERIKELRMSLGLNQIQFGRKLFVTKQCISNWENGNIQPSVTIKKSGKALQPVRIYRHSLLSYNGSGNWTDEALLGHHARYIDSHPRFHYRIRFEQVGLLETTRSCHQTDWIGNETSVE